MKSILSHIHDDDGLDTNSKPQSSWRAPSTATSASSVHLIEVAERTPSAVAEQGALYLSRDGIDAITNHRLAGGCDVGHAIVEAAAKIDAGLIGMGASGHSRLTEFLLGGLTRTMLARSPVRLLLAH